MRGFQREVHSFTQVYQCSSPEDPGGFDITHKPDNLNISEHPTTTNAALENHWRAPGLGSPVMPVTEPLCGPGFHLDVSNGLGILLTACSIISFIPHNNQKGK